MLSRQMIAGQYFHLGSFPALNRVLCQGCRDCVAREERKTKNIMTAQRVGASVVSGSGTNTVETTCIEIPGVYMCNLGVFGSVSRGRTRYPVILFELCNQRASLEAARTMMTSPSAQDDRQ
jgi:hypothetical protein